ncbi:polysaccharide deacetylase family protein [Treponema succinifaciens]|uniref:Polysaccharide deacetylase n=1 Tax=Treponema succinifaciens (strain ATCC 33096 / DSM 2489 / 6091) TaxID=869209 RepID=F2NRP8_TRES6|nr:polysaccharide deacetylase family protein [Treponema succinifaciens]AEB13866.1 polysaccharide deacetylase [Treponema succinifaciens DSM 2489]
MIKRILRKMKHCIQDIGTKGYVLMLHRVSEIESNGIFMNENMKVSPKFLEEFILKYKEKYDFISSTEINDRLKNKSKKKFIVFTMDDGYLDNYTTAFPIFKKYNVPFTVFVASDFPNMKCFLWWHILGDMIKKNDHIKLSDGSIYSCATLEAKNLVFEQLRSKILLLNSQNLITKFCSLFEIDLPELQTLNAKYCMSWENIVELNKNSLVTIGAHTAHHANLRAMKTENDVKREIIEGLNEFENHIPNYKKSVFAYPFGSPFEIGKREIDIVEKMGFTSAFLGCGRGVKQKSCHWAIPRIAFTEDFDFSILK